MVAFIDVIEVPFVVHTMLEYLELDEIAMSLVFCARPFAYKQQHVYVRFVCYQYQLELAFYLDAGGPYGAAQRTLDAPPTEFVTFARVPQAHVIWDYDFPISQSEGSMGSVDVPSSQSDGSMGS